jgi:hypothetical protein
MFLHLNGEYWSKQHCVPIPGGPASYLTEAEIANVPLDRVRRIVGCGNKWLFTFPPTTLSTCMVDRGNVFLVKSNFIAFAAGMHPRLGAASLVLALAGATKLVGLIEHIM